MSNLQIATNLQSPINKKLRYRYTEDKHVINVYFADVETENLLKLADRLHKKYPADITLTIDKIDSINYVQQIIADTVKLVIDDNDYNLDILTNDTRVLFLLDQDQYYYPIWRTLCILSPKSKIKQRGYNKWFELKLGYDRSSKFDKAVWAIKKISDKLADKEIKRLAASKNKAKKLSKNVLQNQLLAMIQEEAINIIKR